MSTQTQSGVEIWHEMHKIAHEEMRELMLKVWYANAWHKVPSLLQHLNSVHRWIVLQLGNAQGQPSHITAKCVCEGT